MASPRTRASPSIPAPSTAVRSRVLEPSTPSIGLSALIKDETIWKRLKEAGFDEETIKKRDKAALVAYISKIEAELYEYQYNMGLLILEKQEWASKYEEAKAAADSADSRYKSSQAAGLTALAEARKQEESLKRALAIEKECVTNIEKALHDMRVESAETKLAYGRKLAEAREMMETAQKKFDEAETKLRSAESLHAEASRYHDSASRNALDIEAREDELRRRMISFQSECDAKEKELSLQRQSLYDSQKILHQEQEKLMEGQSLLNQREDYIYGRLQELSHVEKELDEAKAKFEEECRSIKEKKTNLDLEISALATREEGILERESQLDRRERELLVLQEKISSKEYDEIRSLAAELESALERRRCEFEADLEERRKLFDEEIEAMKASCEVREEELMQREEVIKEKQISVEVKLIALSDREEKLAKKLKLLDEKEQNLQSKETALEMRMWDLQKERDDIKRLQVELEEIKSSLGDEKTVILQEREKLELTVHERNELLVLETKLKEEIDSLRAKEVELDSEADRLRLEKEKFETEWELIDEKREELQKEAERVVEERRAICAYLKAEHDSIKLEKENLRNQLKIEGESLSLEREEFMRKMEHEHSDWIIKIQRERDDFVRDINIQRKELENYIEKRREEVEAYLKEKEEAFEREMVTELQHINSQKQMIAKQLEHVASELKRLDNERMEISLDREQREKEWSEIKSSVDILNSQREKLQKQRELLHADREEINKKIQHLNKLELLDIESENKALFDVHSQLLKSSKMNIPLKKCMNTNVTPDNVGYEVEHKSTADDGRDLELLSEKPSDSTSHLSWVVKKCAGVIFRRYPEKVNAFEGTKGRLNNEAETKHKSRREQFLIQLKEGNSKSAENGATVLLYGKKRLNESLSSDHVEFDHNQRHQKRAKQNKNDTTEENSPVCTLENGRLHDAKNPPSNGVKKTQKQVTDALEIEELESEIVLSKEECEHLIKLAEPHMVKSTVVDSATGKSTDSRVRTSSGMFLQRGQDKIIETIEKRIADFTFIPVEHGEGLQVLHYEVGQKYEPHYDYFLDEFNTKNGGQRIATILMYLSDVEEGGETVFPSAKTNSSSFSWYNELSECGKKGLSVKPKMGDALLFWSMKPDAILDSSSLHGGCPVIKGNKWSSTKWLHVNEYTV